MNWLLIMILIMDGPPRLVIRPVVSQLQCDKIVEVIRSTRPSAVYEYKCIDIAQYAGIGA